MYHYVLLQGIISVILNHERDSSPNLHADELCTL